VKYQFKPLPELYWGVVTAFSVVILTALFTLQPEAVTDWRAWGIALGGGAVRAAAGAGLDYLRRSMTEEPEPAPSLPLPAVDTALVTALADELERRREERVQARLRGELPPLPDIGFSTEIRSG
jgi:hypothetical protein